VCLIRDERRGKGGVSDLYGEFCGGSLAELEYLLIISWLILEMNCFFNFDAGSSYLLKSS
jgi:hypothetical protein